MLFRDGERFWGYLGTFLGALGLILGAFGGLSGTTLALFHNVGVLLGILCCYLGASEMLKINGIGDGGCSDDRTSTGAAKLPGNNGGVGVRMTNNG